MQPPRALWVPFELGRPLGVPGDAALQIRVLLAALRLLEAPSGPVLVDFPEDAPSTTAAFTPLGCPVNFAAPTGERNQTAQLQDALQQEIAFLRPWYDLAMAQRGRTTVGVSGLAPEAMAAFIGACLQEPLPPSPRQGISLAEVFKLAIEDLKAYYSEAVTAQPGQETVSSTAVADWFWRQTTAGKVLLALQEKYMHSDDERLRFISRALLAPRAQQATSA